MKATPTPFGAAWVAAIAISTVLLAAGCREQKSATPPLPANAVAGVGGQIITLEQFQNEMARRAQAAQGRFAEAGEKQSLLDELIRFEVLQQKALAAGYDRDPQVVANLKRVMVARFQEDQLAKLGAPSATAEEIVEFYQKNRQRFGTPEKVRAAVIEIKVARTATAEQRAAASAHAESVLAEARTNAPLDGTFGLVAQRHSEHQSTRYRGGDIGWLAVGATNSEWPAAVTEALSRLSQPGEISPVIATPAGFYLVKLAERQAANVRPLEDVKEGVKYLVARQKEQQRQEELYAALKQGIGIRINQPLLDSLPVPVRETRPPDLPGGPIARVNIPSGK